MAHDSSSGAVGAQAFDLNSKQGVMHVLAAARQSSLSSSEKNELRDLVFLYTNGGGDQSVRIAIEQKLEELQLAPAGSTAKSASEDAGGTPHEEAGDQANASAAKSDSDSNSENENESANVDGGTREGAAANSDDNPDVAEAAVTQKEEDAAGATEPAREEAATLGRVRPAPTFTAPSPTAQAASDAAAAPPAPPATPAPQQTEPSPQPQPQTESVPPKPEPAPAAPVAPEAPAAADPAPEPARPNEPESEPEPAAAPASAPPPPSPQAPAAGSAATNVDPAQLARIREIKRLVNEKVGNPVNLVEYDSAIGREYMNALLDAMKKLSGGAAGGLQQAMERLETAYSAVIELVEQNGGQLIARERGAAAASTQEAAPASAAPTPPTPPTPEAPPAESVESEQPSQTREPIPPQPTAAQPQGAVAAAASPQSPNEGVQPVAEPVSTVPTQPLSDQSGAYTQEPVSETPGGAPAAPARATGDVGATPVLVRTEPSVDTPVEQQPAAPAQAEPQPRTPVAPPPPQTPPPPQPQPEQQTPAEPVAQPQSTEESMPTVTGGVAAQTNAPDVSVPTPEAPTPSAAPSATAHAAGAMRASLADTPSAGPGHAAPGTGEQTVVAESVRPTPTAPTSPRAPSVGAAAQAAGASAGTAAMKPLNQSGAQLKSPQDLPQSSQQAAGESGANQGDPLFTSDVDNGLDQLLSDWDLFKRSGLFGTGPNGRNHPLYKKIKDLQIPLLLAGRFEGAHQEVKQSITDYMNGWRYELGIIYEQGETFEHYLRRVIRHIIDLQNKQAQA